MSPQDVLLELLARVGDLRGESVQITTEELAQWPSEAVKALKAQTLIQRASPASSAQCDGCEAQCTMEVHTVSSPGGKSTFVVCDKRDDINRIEIPLNRLIQWKMSQETVAQFIAKTLDLRFQGKTTGEGLLELGMVRGKRRTQMLHLGWDGELVLVAGTNRLPLADAVLFNEGQFLLDTESLHRLVDTATGEARHSLSTARREARKLNTETMYEAWQKEYRKLKHQYPTYSDRWIAIQIAKMDIAKGRALDTIRKQMTK